MKSQKFISHLFRRIEWNDIDEKYVLQLIQTARAEDIEGAGLKILPKTPADITTRTLTPDVKSSVKLSARKNMTVCGMKLVPIILDVYKSASAENAFLSLSQKTAIRLKPEPIWDRYTDQPI